MADERAGDEGQAASGAIESHIARESHDARGSHGVHESYGARELDDVQELDSLLRVPVADMVWLRTRLAVEAEESGMLDVAYRTLETPVGELLLAATERGLVRVAFEVEGFDEVLQSLASKVSPRVLEAPRRLDRTAEELDEYFTGGRRAFDVPLDHRLSHGFRQRVQRYLPDIDYGSTRSYKEVAEGVGNPKAVRAVGTACASNPLPIILPCHRVLRSDGGLGGYVGGLEAKTALLALERRGVRDGPAESE